MLCALVACGGEISEEQDAGDATQTQDATADVTTANDAPSDVVATDDVADEAALGVLDGGKPFLCGGCICDGLDHYCLRVFGGTNMPLDGGPFGDASVCSPTNPYCRAFPSQCLPDPTCDCLVVNSPYPSFCTCAPDPSGGGLEVTCWIP